MSDELARPRFALFVSSNGRGAQEIIKQYLAGNVIPELGLLFSTVADSRALELARSHGIPTAIVTRQEFASKQQFEERILTVLAEHSIEFVFLTGYTYKVGPVLLNPFRGRMLNIHPSLLPSFKGLRALQQALEYGVKVAGISIHFVNEEIDEGKILLQATVEVADGETVETLDTKIFPLGIRLMIEAINRTFVAKQ